MAKNCISCGKEIDDEASVCELCGSSQAADPDKEPILKEKPVKKKKGFFEIVTFERVVRFGIPIVVILLILILSLVGYSSSYKRSIEKYYKSLCKDKVSKYVTVVSDLQYGGPADESDVIVQTAVDTFSKNIQSDVGKVKKVEISVNSTEKLDEDKLEYIILMSGNGSYDKDSAEKGKIVNFSVIITGADGAKTINCSNYYLLKENGKWKVCVSADSITS